MIPKDELQQMYWNEKMTQSEIAEVVGVSGATICNLMHSYGIKSRTFSEAQFLGSINPLKKSLEKMYLFNKMTVQEIADKIGVAPSTVSRRMKLYGIKIRTQSQLKTGRTGEKNGNWRGGISKQLYCDKFNNKFREDVRKRDDYTCQLCGYKQELNGRKLSVHHIYYKKEDCYPDCVALCSSCNSKVNSNRDYWELYFESHLLERGLLYWSINI